MSCVESCQIIDKRTYLISYDTVESIFTSDKAFVNQDTILKEYIPTEETFKTIVVKHLKIVHLVENHKTAKTTLWKQEGVRRRQLDAASQGILKKMKGMSEPGKLWVGLLQDTGGKAALRNKIVKGIDRSRNWVFR